MPPGSTPNASWERPKRLLGVPRMPPGSAQNASWERPKTTRELRTQTLQAAMDQPCIKKRGLPHPVAFFFFFFFFF